MYGYVCLSVRPSTHPYVWWSVCPSARLNASFSHSVYLVFLSAYMSVCLSALLEGRPPACPLARAKAARSSACLPMYLPPDCLSCLSCQLCSSCQQVLIVGRSVHLSVRPLVIHYVNLYIYVSLGQLVCFLKPCVRVFIFSSK